MHQLRRIAIPGALIIAALAFVIGPNYVGSSAQRSPSRSSELTSTLQDGNVADHPIVGAWIVVNTERPRQPIGFALFHSDGTIVFTDANGVSSYGAWEAVDETSVDFNILGFSSRNRSIRGNSGSQSVTGVRSFLGEATVIQDGNAFQATATLSTTTLDGPSVTEPGTISLRGARIDASGGVTTGVITPRGARAPASPVA
jgi:hypothetical protein